MIKTNLENLQERCLEVLNATVRAINFVPGGKYRLRFFIGYSKGNSSIQTYEYDEKMIVTNNNRFGALVLASKILSDLGYDSDLFLHSMDAFVLNDNNCMVNKCMMIGVR